MSSRVTSAIASRKARENLVRLLFPQDHFVDSRRRPKTCAPSTSPVEHDIDRHNHRHRRRPNDNVLSAHNTADNLKRHSYSQLRSAYLQKVHEMHPDKMASQTKKNVPEDYKNAHLQFIDLKHAWEEYHASVRIIQRKKNDDLTTNNMESTNDDEFWEVNDDFTMFGVGCSFADSEEERNLRNKIMDQACQGWFSSGSLTGEKALGYDVNTNTATDSKQQQKSLSQPQLKLCDDDMFVSSEDEQSAKEDPPKNKKCLVQNVDSFRRKR